MFTISTTQSHLYFSIGIGRYVAILTVEIATVFLDVIYYSAGAHARGCVVGQYWAAILFETFPLSSSKYVSMCPGFSAAQVLGALAGAGLATTFLGGTSGGFNAVSPGVTVSSNSIT